MNNSHTVGNSLMSMSAINEESLDKLVVEIYDYASKIKSILDSVEDIVDLALLIRIVFPEYA